MAATTPASFSAPTFAPGDRMGPYTFTACDFYEKMTDLVNEQTEFSRRVFGPDSVRGPKGPLEHLAMEAQEAVKAWRIVQEHAGGVGTKEAKLEFLTELGDCLILLLDAARRGGFKFGHVVDAAREKMKVNLQREKDGLWPLFDPANADNPVEHIRKDGE